MIQETWLVVEGGKEKLSSPWPTPEMIHCGVTGKVGFVDDLPFHHDLMVEHSFAADFFGAEPEGFAQQFFPVQDDIRLRISQSSQVEDMAALTSAVGGK